MDYYEIVVFFVYVFMYLSTYLFIFDIESHYVALTALRGHCVDQAGLEFTEIYLPLLPEG